VFRFVLPVVLVVVAGSPAAPLPPPRPLSAELLVGKMWDYRWQGMSDGWIVFTEDGRYFSAHGQYLFSTCTGPFIVEGNVLTLYEGWCRGNGSPEAANWTKAYPITLSTAKYPVLAGKCELTTVVLSNPRPHSR
jgi:hypothetical protein